MKKVILAIILEVSLVITSIVPSFANAPRDGYWNTSYNGGVQISYDELSNMVTQCNQAIEQGQWDNFPSYQSDWATFKPVAYITEFSFNGSTAYCILLQFNTGTAKSTTTLYYCARQFYWNSNLNYQQTYKVYYALADKDNPLTLKPLYELLSAINTYSGQIKNSCDSISSHMTYTISGRTYQLTELAYMCHSDLQSLSTSLGSKLDTISNDTANLTKLTTITTRIGQVKNSVDNNTDWLDAIDSGISTTNQRINTSNNWLSSIDGRLTTANNYLSSIEQFVSNLQFDIGYGDSTNNPMYTIPSHMYLSSYKTDNQGVEYDHFINSYVTAQQIVAYINSEMVGNPMTRLPRRGEESREGELIRYVDHAYVDDNNMIRVVADNGLGTLATYFLCSPEMALFEVADAILFDDSDINDNLDSIEQKIDNLNTMVSSINDNVSYMKRYINNEIVFQDSRLTSMLQSYSASLQYVVTSPFEKYYIRLFGSSFWFNQVIQGIQDTDIYGYFDDPTAGTWGGLS